MFVELLAVFVVVCKMAARHGLVINHPIISENLSRKISYLKEKLPIPTIIWFGVTEIMIIIAPIKCFGIAQISRRAGLLS